MSGENFTHEELLQIRALANELDGGPFALWLRSATRLSDVIRLCAQLAPRLAALVAKEAALVEANAAAQRDHDATQARLAAEHEATTARLAAEATALAAANDALRTENAALVSEHAELTERVRVARRDLAEIGARVRVS